MSGTRLREPRSMQKRLRILTVSVLAACVAIAGFTSATAQPEGCGTVVTRIQVEAEKDRARRLPSIGAAADPSTIYAVPLALHIIRQTDGSGGLSVTDLNTALDLGNGLWAQSNIHAYQYGPIDFIDSDMFYFGTDNSSMYNLLREINVVPEAINIYFLPNESGFPYCGLSSFTTSSVQGILMNNLCVLIEGTSSTLVHEIGHYFDLYHTHEPAIGVECPDGSNCASTGDLVCDTPADPNLSGHVSSAPGCVYDDYASPPGSCDGTPYAPQTNNIMSYSTKPCRDLYTAGQTARLRTILENDRTELAITVGGVFAYPGAIDYGPVPLGGTAIDSVELTYVMAGTVDILSATSTGGNLTIGGTLPITIDNTDTIPFEVTFDASSLTGECDRGLYFDTVVFTTTDTESPTLSVPVTLALGFTSTTPETNLLETQCASMTLDNTTGIQDYIRSSSDVVYDASLMVGVVDGSDTTVYRTFSGGSGFIPVGAVTSGAGTRTVEVFSVDSRVQGEVVYTFDGTNPDSCDFVYINYSLYNPCDTPLQVLSGLAGDFDLDDAGTNEVGFDETRNMVYMSNAADTRLVGMALLSDTPRNLRAINNPAEIWTGFTDGAAYAHLASSSNVDGNFLDDWSMLLTFGENVIGPSDTAEYRMVMMYSLGGLSGLEAIYDKLLGSGTCCLPPSVGDIDQSGVVDISDISVLIDNQFLSLTPLVCFDEGDMDFSGGVDVTDLSILIDNQFLTLTPLPACP